MCDCTSCKVTDSYRNAGFKKWPRGEPAGPGASARAYKAHVAHSYFGAHKRVGMGPTGAGFYGTPAGLTRAEVEAVLREAFKYPPPPEPEETQVVEIPTRRKSLLALAQELRKAA